VSYELMLFSLLTVAAVKLMLLGDVIRRDLHLDDAYGVKCLSNEEIFAELARMGCVKPPSKLTFYKVFFSAQWKFLIHTIVQSLSAKRTAWNEFSCSMASIVTCLATGVNTPRCDEDSIELTELMVFMSLSAKRTAWNEFSCSMASSVICLATVVMDNQVDDPTSHNTRYTSPALTHKVFDIIQRVGKGFLGVETPLFASMLVLPQPQAKEEEVEVPIAHAPSPPDL
nr:hypothetical protein [Tanacetum cinerariifolium]